MKALRKILIVIGVVGFVFIIGSAGALDRETISITRGVWQMIGGFAAVLLAMAGCRLCK